MRKHKRLLKLFGVFLFFSTIYLGIQLNYKLNPPVKPPVGGIDLVLVWKENWKKLPLHQKVEFEVQRKAALDKMARDTAKKNEILASSRVTK